MIGIVLFVLGVLVTIAVTRYYYRRSRNKSLGVYLVLNSPVFYGIAPDVRDQLTFRFRDRRVDELQQLVLLVANDGDRAVSNLIEPLMLTLPHGAEVLDAAVIHRSPLELEVEVETIQTDSGQSKITFGFELLNPREWFVVKLLLSGWFAISDVALTLLAEELPRTIRIAKLPTKILEDKESTSDLTRWQTAAILLGCLVVASWPALAVCLFYRIRLDLFPPWISWEAAGYAAIFLFLGLPVILFMLLVVFMAIAYEIIGVPFRHRKALRFPLPAELRGAILRRKVLALAPGIHDQPPDIQ